MDTAEALAPILTVKTETIDNNLSDESEGHVDDGDDGTDTRMGTVTSGRFNLLSTMVGGGSLSLPLAFHKSGNALMGPFFMILVAASAEFCIRLLIASSNMVLARSGPLTYTTPKKGSASLEAVVSAAFGPKAHYFSMVLIVFLCYFATVGYAVLLRDMLQPITDAIVPPPDSQSDGPTFAHNITMLTIMLLVTPFCTLRTLTALRRAGAASMLSVFILGSCVVYRSLQCNVGLDHAEDRHTSWTDYMTLFPSSVKDFLDVLPLYVSCFVCHYNVLPVQNELQNPTPTRVNWLVRSMIWTATLFYIIVGFAGSMYGNCTPSGTVHGNVLLDFDEHDPLLLMGRLCLSLTLTAAFPMLVIPPRDIIIREWQNRSSVSASSTNDNDNIRLPDPDFSLPEVLVIDEHLREPLLTEVEEHGATDASHSNDYSTSADSASLLFRSVAAVMFFWSGAALACCVSSIDVVWDLLGSSLSILLSYLIPCGSFLVIESQRRVTIDYADSLGAISTTWKTRLALLVAWILVILFVPLMFVSTGNAVYNTFFAG